MPKELTLDELYDLCLNKLVYEPVTIYVQSVSRTRTFGAGAWQTHYMSSLDISLYNAPIQPKYCSIEWCKKRYGTRRVNRRTIHEYRADP